MCARKKRATYYVDPATIEANAAGTDKLAFALTLNQLLEDRGIDQEQLANDVGLSTSVISEYRSGKSEPRLSSIKKIAARLGVDCHYLITGIKATNITLAKSLGLSDASISNLCELQKNRQNKDNIKSSIHAEVFFDGIDFLLTCQNSDVIIPLISEIIFMGDCNESLIVETLRGNDTVSWETYTQKVSVNVALLELQNILKSERLHSTKKYEVAKIVQKRW